MSKVLDFHHHVTPPEYIKKMEQLGVSGNTGVKFKKFNPKKNLMVMNKAKIHKAFLSISTPGVYVKNNQVSADLARTCNDYIALMKSEHPERYGGFAALPFPAHEESLKELEYAMDTLKLDGVAMLSSANGVYFGVNGYDELFSELDKRKAIVFIHPEDVFIHKGTYVAITGIFERLIDTTRAAYNLLLNGYMNKYKNIKFILSHGGGVLPMIASKITQNKEQKQLLKRFYFDTAQRGNEILSGLKAFCGSEQVVFGSDIPYQPAFEILTAQKELNAFNGFDKKQKERIFSGGNIGIELE